MEDIIRMTKILAEMADIRESLELLTLTDEDPDRIASLQARHDQLAEEISRI